MTMIMGISIFISMYIAIYVFMFMVIAMVIDIAMTISMTIIMATGARYYLNIEPCVWFTIIMYDDPCLHITKLTNQ